MNSASRLPAVLIFAISLGAGYGLALVLRCARPAADSSAISSVTAPDPASKATSRTATGQPLTLDACLDLIAGAHQAPSATSSTGSDLVEQLAAWSDDEIRRALNATLASPDLILAKSDTGKLINILVHEWLRRDSAGFTRWLDSVQPEAVRCRVAGYALWNWPPAQAEEGLAYFLGHPALFTGDNRSFTYGLLNQGCASAAARSPQALADLMRAARESGLPQAQIVFPKGFDYRTFTGLPEIQELWKQGGAGPIISSMIRDNRDVAFDTIALHEREFGIRNQSTLTRLVQSEPGDPALLFQDPAGAQEVQTARDREQASWLGAKLASLSDDERSRLIPNLVLNMRDSTQLDTFIAALTDPASRTAAHEQAVATHLFTNGVDFVIPHLEALGDPATRIALLENVDLILPADPFRPADAGPSPTPRIDTALLTAKLTEWQATPEQIGNILAHLQQEPH